jgi:hypothetical protein
VALVFVCVVGYAADDDPAGVGCAVDGVFLPVLAEAAGFHVDGEDFFVVRGEVGADVAGPVGDDGFAGPDDSGVDLVLVACVSGHLAVDASRCPVVGEVGVHGVDDVRRRLSVFSAAAGVLRIDLAVFVVDDVGGDDDVADSGVVVMDASGDADEGPQTGFVVAA